KSVSVPPLSMLISRVIGHLFARRDGRLRAGAGPRHRGAGTKDRARHGSGVQPRTGRSGGMYAAHHRRRWFGDARPMPGGDVGRSVGTARTRTAREGTAM